MSLRQFKKGNRQHGFTLIELMIAVSIIGILAMISVQAYQDYTIRSQVSEGLTLASAIKASSSEYYQDRGVWPQNNKALGINTVSGKYVTDISVSNGSIDITYGVQANLTINGEKLSLRPATNINGDIAWVCGTRNPPAGHTVAGTDATTFTATTNKYVPSNCKL